jgi:predicted dinucleotide-binding enzyme
MTMQAKAVGLGVLVVLMGTLISLDATAQDPQTVAVIGTGRVAAALGPRFGALGFEVIYGSRDPGRESVQALVAKSGKNARAVSQADAAQAGDWILLAVPWGPMETLIPGLGPLDGKVIIDVTNAIAMGKDGNMEMIVASSAGELIQSWAPDAHVVKAFNAMGYHIMADPNAGGGTTTVPIAGNDDGAKAAVASVIQRLGFETADVGPIKHAHQLEGMAVLYMVPYLRGPRSEAFEYYFRKGAGSTVTTVRPAE